MAESAAQTYAPGLTIDDHSSLVKIAVYFLAVTFVLSVIFRFAIRLGIAKTVNVSDWLCLGSMVVGIGEAIAVLLGVEHGLGKKDSLLTRAQDRAVVQAEYAGDVLFVLALGLAKGSVLMLLCGICVNRKHRLITLSTCCVVVMWTLGGIIALAARCGSHLPWTVTNVHGQCMNLTAFWSVMLSVDILTEIIIVTIPIFMVIRLQTAVSKKFVIVTAFMFRLALVAASIIRVFYLVDYIPSTNFAYRTVNTEIVNQAVLMASITSACIPCLKPFLDVFDSGQMAVRLPKGTAHSISNSYAMHSIARENVHPQTEVSQAKEPSVDSNHLVNDQADSVSSDTRSDKMIINKKMEYTVQYENADASPDTPYKQRSSHGPSGSWH